MLGNLGKGAFGTVFLSSHKLSKVKYAVKLIKKELVKKVFTDNGQVFAELDILK